MDLMQCKRICSSGHTGFLLNFQYKLKNTWNYCYLPNYVYILSGSEKDMLKAVPQFILFFHVNLGTS